MRLYLIIVITSLYVRKSSCEVLDEGNDEIFDIDLPKNHLSQYFNNLPTFTKKLNESSNNGFYKDFLNSEEFNREACWGYEYGCIKPLHTHKCPGNHTGYVQSKEIQLDVFYSQADFGYVKQQLREMQLFCEPYALTDSSLECSENLRFCRGRNVMINFTDLLNREEPFRWDINVLKHGDISGFCRFHKDKFSEHLDHLGALQSWAAELRNFKSLTKRPIESDLCDLIVEKPTFVMKLDSSVNLYHHFCDFFNLYISQHVNFTHPSSFSTDVNILIWETYPYISLFSETFKAFTDNELWNLNNFKGKVVCFKNLVFTLPPRMIFGLFYNTPLINGCENSALFHAFSEHLLHRLQIKEQSPNERKIRITFLSRNTKYRNVLNEKALLKRISLHSDYDVRRVVYDRNIKFLDQITITRNTDVFIGMHGAGLTHLLFLPKWATLFELYHCGDPNCYHDLARLRGVNYITWEDEAFLESINAGYADETHEKFKNYNFDPDEFARLVAKAVKAVRKSHEYKEYIRQLEQHDEL